mmetsp:Transcript_36571/g.85846  ORF Transcript_36571/g.85846 Transcript_36571/m.85846 type:complete len:341 (-) Transcript_36571:32-1054(-)
MKELCGGFVVCGAHFGALEGDVVKRGDLGLQHLVLVKLGLRLEFRVNVESLLITLEGKVWAAPLLLHAGHVRVHAGDCRVPAAVALLEDGECFLQVGQRHVGLLWLQLKGDADAVLHGGKLPVLLPVHLLDDGQRLFERLLGLLSSPLPLLHPPQSHGCICSHNDRTRKVSGGGILSPKTEGDTLRNSGETHAHHLPSPCSPHHVPPVSVSTESETPKHTPRGASPRSLAHQVLGNKKHHKCTVPSPAPPPCIRSTSVPSLPSPPLLRAFQPISTPQNPGSMSLLLWLKDRGLRDFSTHNPPPRNAFEARTSRGKSSVPLSFGAVGGVAVGQGYPSKGEE